MSLSGLGIRLDDSSRLRFRRAQYFVMALVWLAWAAALFLVFLPGLQGARGFVDDRVLGAGGIADLVMWTVFALFFPPVISGAVSGERKLGRYVGDWSVFTKLLVVAVSALLSLTLLGLITAAGVTTGQIGWQIGLNALIAALFGVPAVYVIRNWSGPTR